MGSKLPFMQFYVSDWLLSPELSQCAPATKGIWIDLICHMHQQGRTGVLSGTVTSFSRLLRCDVTEFRNALRELNVTNVATVTERNDQVTVTCRRINKEFKSNNSNAERQKRYRQNKQSNASVTPYIRTEQNRTEPEQNITDGETPKNNAADAAVCEIPKSPHPKSSYSPEFEAFWSLYPAQGRKAKGGAWKAWQKLKPDRDLQLRMADAIEKQTEAREAKRIADPRAFIPEWKHCATWINQRCWEDEIAAEKPKTALPVFPEPAAIESAPPQPPPYRIDHHNALWAKVRDSLVADFELLADAVPAVHEDTLYLLMPTSFAAGIASGYGQRVQEALDAAGGLVSVRFAAMPTEEVA